MPGRPRGKAVRRAWLSLLGFAIVVALAFGLLIFTWMIDETRFDRPSEQFDALASQIDRLPGVDHVETERWVEAPTFSAPTSSLAAVVDAAALPRLLNAVCSTAHPDPITWSLRVQTTSTAAVTLFATSGEGGDIAGQGDCLEFGFDAVGLVDGIDRAAPGLAVQPLIPESARLMLVALDDEASDGFRHLLPLVEHSEDLIVAAGLDPDSVLEVNASHLGVVLEPGESDGYLSLLSRLAERHAVSAFWADTADRQMDGIAKLQLVAPGAEHQAIENAIRESGLRIADLPIRFIDQ